MDEDNCPSRTTYLWQVLYYMYLAVHVCIRVQALYVRYQHGRPVNRKMFTNHSSFVNAVNLQYVSIIPATWYGQLHAVKRA